MIKRVLTIAGSDSGGGAGIQADLKTFSAFGVYGMSVVTAVTAQNTVGINGMIPISPEFVSLQFESVLADIGMDGVKTGMLHSAGSIHAVASKLRENAIPFVVVDPVMTAKDGYALLQGKGINVLKNELIPLATLLTPNIPEAEILSDMSILSLDDINTAAKKIHELGCGAVLIKGGHLKGKATDVLFDGDACFTLNSPRIATKNTHGTGCTLSAAILANLVKGISLGDAIRISKTFITEAIRKAFPLGKGHGPLNHFIDVKDLYHTGYE